MDMPTKLPDFYWITDPKKLKSNISSFLCFLLFDYENTFLIKKSWIHKFADISSDKSFNSIVDVKI